ncbi:MAG: PorT family protein [Chitinophagaceae bacterium]|nr:PorT family protein [Chitinophagaceae bacterium]
MKKIFFVFIVALLTGTTALAQKDDKLVTIGLRAGVNLQKIYGKELNGDKVNSDFKTGFHAGVTADLLVTPAFFLQPALLYSTKGAEKTEDNIKKTQRISYIELPINLLFKPELGGGKLLLGAGPYAAYGISGQFKSKTGNAAIEVDTKFKNTITPSDFLNTNNVNVVKPFDFGANALVGYEFNNGLNFQINGQLGLAKINPQIESVSTDINKTNTKNAGVSFSVGYKF